MAAWVLLILANAAARADAGIGDLGQYRRTQWGYEQGLTTGLIRALAQTPDGYLWIGTTDALLRFDGFHFTTFLTADNQPLRHILGLAVDKAGTLWVRTEDKHLFRIDNGVLSSPYPFDHHALTIVSMSPGATEGLYAAEASKDVFHLTEAGVEQLPIHRKSPLLAVAQGTDGKVWIGTRDEGLLSWDGKTLVARKEGHIDSKVNCLLATEAGRMWVGTDDGLAYWDGSRILNRALPEKGMRHLQILAMLEDRESNLWIATSTGLLRYSSSSAERVSQISAGENSAVGAVIQDREGDIWFGSGSTLERLQRTPLSPVRQAANQVDEQFGPVYVDRQHRLWFAGLRGGLFWQQDNVVHPVLVDGLAKDVTYSIDGNGDDIWIGRREGGLTRLRLHNGIAEYKTWTTVDGLSQNSVYAVRAMPDGAVWAGTLTGGLNLFGKGHFTHFEERDGLPANDISAIELGSQGEVWIGTSNGVCKIDNTRCTPLTAGASSATRDVHSLLAEPPRGLWIGTSHGLLLADEHGQRPILLGTGPQPNILGLGMDKGGRLWIVSGRAVISAMPSELLASKNPPIRTYGSEDGLASNEGVHRSRSVVTDNIGQVWMTTAHQLAMIRATPTPLPTVIPHVEEISADGVLLDPNKAEVSPGAKRLSFSFTGLDLHAPSRVRFRYRLDDFDKTWSNVVHDRAATYTNLAPGTYTFRLIASNDSDSWSSEESTVSIVIEPRIWQRWSIRSSFAAIFLLLLVLCYHARTRFLVAQANILADERLRERTRIARDVHDTLLQGFISSLMHLHVAQKQIASDSPLKQRFAFVLEGMERVIEEARLSVVGLRTPDSGHGGIESSLRDFFQEIADFGDAQITLRSTGRPRRLKTVAFEQVCSIAKEAILNAVRHAGARNVQVAIAWGWLHLRVSVTDDGCGIDAYTLEHGRAQHWGLVGMRERAKHLKGRLTIVSRADEGTKVSLIIPAPAAYRGLKESGRSPDAE